MVDNIVQNSVNLPDKIEKILFSNYQRVLMFNLRNKYKLTDDQVKIMEDSLNNLFDNQLNINNLVEDLTNKFNDSKIDIKSLARDIVGLRLYIAEDYFRSLGQDLKKYLEDSGGLSKDYLDNKEIFQKALADEAAGTYDHNKYLYLNDKEPAPDLEVEEDDDEVDDDQSEITELTDQEQLNSVKKFFDEGLIDTLEISNDEDAKDLLEDINDELIYLLVNLPEAQKTLRDNLLTAKFLIGQEGILIDGKPVPATGANWLKDFFSVVGAENFDTLSIARYIITSDNAKKLDEATQNKLRKFLILYHNINYFPTPFAALPVEKWEIIPGALTAEEPIVENNPEPIKQASSLVVKKPVDEVKPTQASPVDDQQILELKNMLLQYPEGSLERKAIEEEIAHLNQ